MTREPGGRHNGFKHGGFSQDLILDDEDSEEFEQLLQSLFDEWNPTGALEEDTVLTLAQGIWMKRRVERFYAREAMWAQQHPGDEAIGRASKLSEHLDRAKSDKSVKTIIDQLPGEYKECIQQESPRSKFDDMQSWIQSVKSNILACTAMHDTQIGEECANISYIGERAARLRYLTAKKIAIDERLDARIDKAIKRLAQLKTFKQVIEASVSQKSNEPRRISDPQQ